MLRDHSLDGISNSAHYSCRSPMSLASWALVWGDFCWLGGLGRPHAGGASSAQANGPSSLGTDLICFSYFGCGAFGCKFSLMSIALFLLTNCYLLLMYMFSNLISSCALTWLVPRFSLVCGGVTQHTHRVDVCFTRPLRSCGLGGRPHFELR